MRNVKQYRRLFTKNFSAVGLSITSRADGDMLRDFLHMIICRTTGRNDTKGFTKLVAAAGEVWSIYVNAEQLARFKSYIRRFVTTGEVQVWIEGRRGDLRRFPPQTSG